MESRRTTPGGVIAAADWYDSQRAGLGDEFIEEFIAVFDALELNPLLNCRRHPTKNLGWRYPKRFPYRVSYEVIDADRLVIIVAVIHAVRHDRVWQRPSVAATSSAALARGAGKWRLR